MWLCPHSSKWMSGAALGCSRSSTGVDIAEALVFMESCKVFSRHPLRRRLRSARCRGVCVCTWGWLHRPRKSVCVQVHVYSHTAHLHRNAKGKLLSSGPPGWSRPDLTWKAKFKGVNSRPCRSLHGIKDCVRACPAFWFQSEPFKGERCAPTDTSTTDSLNSCWWRKN